MPYIGKKPADIIATAVDTTTGTFSGAFTSPGIDDNADATAITIDSNENIAIGVTSKNSANNGSLTIGHTGMTKITGTANGNADELILIGANASANVGMSIISNNANQGIIYFGDEDDTDRAGFIYDHNGDYLAINTNALERMRINDDGNVLIGRTSELTDFGDGRTSLVLQGTGSQDYSTIQMGSNGTASNTQILGILAFYDGTENNARVQSVRATSTDSADLLFSTREASGSISERVRIKDDGKFTVGSSTAESGSLA